MVSSLNCGAMGEVALEKVELVRGGELITLRGLRWSGESGGTAEFCCKTEGPPAFGSGLNPGKQDGSVSYQCTSGEHMLQSRISLWQVSTTRKPWNFSGTHGLHLQSVYSQY